MKTKIYLVTFTSWNNEDYGTLHLSTAPATTNEEEARKTFRENIEYARRVAANEYDDLGNGMTYDVNVSEYESDATISRETDNDDERYTAKVLLESQEIDVPFATDRRKYGMTLKEIRDEIAAFTGDKKGEAMRKAKIFAHHISIAHVCRIRLSFGTRDHGDGTHTEERSHLVFRWTDLDGDQDTFSIIE